MKRILKIAAVLLTAVTLAGCSGSVKQNDIEPYTPELAPAHEDGCVTPPFWVVQDEDTGAQIFLMGSIHVGTEDVKYPQYVLQAFQSSSYIAPEMDTVAFSGDYFLKKKCVEYIRLKDGTAADYIGGDYPDILEFFQQNGIYQSGMDSMIPYYWASAATVLIAQNAGLDSNYSSETIMLNLAHGTGKTVREIEGGEEQYKMMSEIPMSVQLELLGQSAGDENAAQQTEATRALYDAWCSFDDQYFRQNTSLGDDLSDDWQKYYDMMYTDRQLKMAEFITDSLKAGEQGFVMVGTMHFYAETSIIDLLHDEGYTVQEIRPEQSGVESSAA
ncbi:MAG: TraB/GumN family protein [Oscillospiraceae bacterium]